MSRQEIGKAQAGLDGVSLETAISVVDDESATSDAVRETLAVVADDGVVRRTAVDDALANASKVVTTAETRTELAANSLENVRDIAAPVSEIDIVETRLDRFVTRLEIVEDRATDLGDHLQTIIAHKNDGNLYDLAREIRRLTATANEVQRAADELQFELENFEEWLEDADRRVAELTDDIEALEQSLDELEDVATELSGESTEPEEDAAAVWMQATIQHRVTGLMLTDLQAELATLREWAEDEGSGPPSGVDQRLEDLEERHDALGNRFANRAESGWHERFDDRVAMLDDTLGEMEPPIEWGDVETVVEEYRPTVE